MTSRSKLISIEDFELIRDGLRHKKIVFTNGCFDILHPGHVDYLEKARSLGDMLVVGLNSDSSVRRIKHGKNRPVNPQKDRARVLSGLACVDLVIIFDQDTPYRLIHRVLPKVLVKGGDWPVEDIIGRDIVLNLGGEVLSIPLTPGYSTTGIISRIAGK